MKVTPNSIKDETSQYENDKSYLRTQPLVNPNHLCSIDSSTPSFANDHDENLSEIPPNTDECRGREDINVISKLRNGKNLIDSYEISLENNPKNRVEDDLESEKTQESDKEKYRFYPSPKDYVPLIPFSSALKSAKERPSDPHLLEIFKESTITIPLIDDIQNIPSYFEFVKDLFTPSRKTKRFHIF